MHNLGLLPFLTNSQCYYPELVRVFYSNLQITDEGVILSEVKHVKGSVLRETWWRNGEMIIRVTMQK